MNSHTPSSTIQSFGARLRWARENRGLNQSELAALVKIKPSLISELEANRYKSSKYAPAIAAICGVSTLWLAYGRGLPDINKQIESNAEYLKEIASGTVPKGYSAIAGIPESDDHVIGGITLNRDWLKFWVRSGGKPTDMVIASNAGTATDGIGLDDMLLIDRSVTDKRPGQYAYQQHGCTIVVPHTQEPPADAELIGRIAWVWSGRRL